MSDFPIHFYISNGAIKFSKSSISKNNSDIQVDALNVEYDSSIKNFEVDYVILGAGTAGCEIASILCRKFKVLLLEGGSDMSSDPQIINPERAPANWSVNPAYYWNLPKSETFKDNTSTFKTNENFDYGGGKLSGGSSSINGMQAVRGTTHTWSKVYEASDLDKDWSPESIYLYYTNLETFYPADGLKKNSRGSHGKLSIREAPEKVSKLSFDFVKSVENVTKVDEVEDYNDLETSLGAFTRWQYTQTKDRKRASSNTAFLNPLFYFNQGSRAMGNAGLIEVLYQVQFSKINWNKNEVESVSFKHQNSNCIAKMKRGFIVCTGIQSPIILLQNGKLVNSFS
jgi:choline dehydrogenase-like flavoprotein